MRVSLFIVALVSIANVESLIKSEIEQRLEGEPHIRLLQSDFASGTYRIHEGGYFELGEHILFDPQPEAEKLRTDKPVSGWFASITVETEEPVIIDLKNFMLASSVSFDEAHVFNVFAQIELDNCPFSGTLYGFPNPHQALVNFKSDLIYVSASNVIIKNGMLGRSGHWGIHGNNNSNIHIENMIIKDWEVRGIELNGLVHGSIKNVEISGLEHVIKTSVPLVGVLHVKEILHHLAAQGYKDAKLRLQKLEEFLLDENAGTLNPAQTLPIGTIGGLFIAGGGVSNVDFPVTTSMCAHAAKMTGGRTCDDIVIEDVVIHDAAVNSVQFAAIGSKYQGPQGNSIGIENVGLLPGGSLLWKDAYDTQGNFAPNEPLIATVFVALALLAHNPKAKKMLPKNFDKIAQSILENNETLFLENAVPIYTYPSHKIKGLFGMRIEGAQNVIVQNCSAYNLSSVGAKVTEIFPVKVQSIATRTSHHNVSINVGTNDAQVVVLPAYRGNDIWGYEFAVCKNCIIHNCIADTIVSHNGNPFGFELIADDDSVVVDNCHAQNIISYGATMDSNITMPSESYGFRVKDTKTTNTFINCWASGIYAPVRSFGFAAELCTGALFENCSVYDVVSSSTHADSLDPEKQQVSFGFNTEGASGTCFKNCSANQIQCAGTTTGTNSALAAGFACTENDLNSKIVGCSVTQAMAANGNVYSIFVDDTSVLSYNAIAYVLGPSRPNSFL